MIGTNIKHYIFIFKHMFLVSGLVFISFLCLLILQSSHALAVPQDCSKPFIAVLVYHHIIPGQLPKGATTHAVIPLAEFEAQMKYLHDNGYYTASLKDVEDFLYNKKKLPEKTVLITFDDGYESNFIYAFPILKSYKFRATIFLIGNSIVQKEEPFNPSRLSKLSFREIKEMLGLVEFGSHTFDAHKYIRKKPVLLSMNKEQIEQDFARETEVFTRNGIPAPIAVAYPYGKFNSTVLEAAKRFGYKLGFTIQDGFVYQSSYPFTLNRIIVPPGTDIARFKALLKNNLSFMPSDFKNSIVLQIGSNNAYIKGKPLILDSCAFIENGRIMVPLRFIAQSLGARVDWISTERKIIVRTPGKTIELWAKPLPILPDDGVLWGDAGNFHWQEAIVNGNKVFLDAPPIIRFNRTIVPLRFLSESLGYKVKWYQVKNMIEVNCS